MTSAHLPTVGLGESILLFSFLVSLVTVALFGAAIWLHHIDPEEMHRAADRSSASRSAGMFGSVALMLTSLRGPFPDTAGEPWVAVGAFALRGLLLAIAVSLVVWELQRLRRNRRNRPPPPPPEGSWLSDS